MSRHISQIHVMDSGSTALRLVSDTSVRPSEQTPNERLRAAARAVDRSSCALRKEDAERVIRIWEGLVQGRSELVDWFDSDGRRFIIARLRSGARGCARGLTERERQVALSAALGESSKLTSYRLGISPSRVSALLKAAMRKLGVRTKAQLVVMVRLLQSASIGSPLTAEVKSGHA